MEGNFKDGKEEGLFTSWHDNGQKKNEGKFKDGKKEGLITTWRYNGQKESEENFKDGRLTFSKYWNSKGEEVDSYEEAEE